MKLITACLLLSASMCFVALFTACEEKIRAPTPTPTPATGQTVLTPTPALTSTATGTKRIEGQVFIVTAGGPVIKLALVQVGAIPRAVMEKYLADVEPKINAGRRDAELAADNAVAKLEKIKKTRSERSDRIVELIKRKNYWEEERALFDEYLESENRADEAVAHKKMWNSAAPYFVELPQPIASAKTDAEGRFQMNLPDDGDYILVANAERTVFKAVEKYYWVVLLRQEETKVMLSNDNLTASGSPNSALTTKE